MPDPIIKKPFEYFNVVTYTGTGSTQSITGVGFKPDFVWIKGRGNAENHALFDAVRGANKNLASNTTGTEGTQTDMLMSFDTDGFTLGADGNWQVNKASTAYVAWCWKASNATAVTNTAGSITSTVSANTSAGFSIVNYVGNNTSGATVGHGLGVAPSMIIVKNRDQATAGGDSQSWFVYHRSIGATGQVALNSTGAVVTNAEYWNNTAPSSTVFSLGNGNRTNFTGDDYIAYCFSEVAGFSKFGSYTGNGSSDGTFVATGFKPKFVMVKSTSNLREWFVIDTARNTYNVANSYLRANTSAAEGTATMIDMVSNGFKLRSSDTAFNGSGETYIYMAFAEVPAKFALGV